MLFQPFLVSNAWPKKLGIPFHKTTSVFYISSIPSSVFSLLQVSVYAAILLVVEISIWGIFRDYLFHKGARFRYVGSRILYDAFYCVAVFKSFSYLSFYECPASSGIGTTRRTFASLTQILGWLQMQKQEHK